MNKGALKGSTPDKAVARWKNIASTRTKVNDLDTDIKDTKDAIDFMLKAYDRATSSDETLHAELLKLRSQALGLTQQFGGSKARSEVGEKSEYPTSTITCGKQVASAHHTDQRRPIWSVSIMSIHFIMT